MVLANFTQRIGAAIFDFFTIAIFSGLISFYLLTFDINGEYFISYQKFNFYFLHENFFIANLPLILGNFIFGLTIVLFWIFNNGSTIGQKIFNVKVVNKHNENMSIKQAFFRGFIYTIFYNVLLTHIISTIMILFRDDKLSIHDFLVGSKVVKIKE